MRRGLRPRPSNVDESTGALLGFEVDALSTGAGFGGSILGLEVNSEEIICVCFAGAAVVALLVVDCAGL